MARSRSMKSRPPRRPRKAATPATSPATAQVDLQAMLFAKRTELIAKLREDREGRREIGHREKIEGAPFGDRPGLSPDDEMGFAVADRRAEMLVQIDLALKKMEEGSYGRCEACEEPINVLRLRAHPFAVRCTRCQEVWERDQSRAENGTARPRTAAEELS